MCSRLQLLYWCSENIQEYKLAQNFTADDIHTIKFSVLKSDKILIEVQGWCFRTELFSFKLTLIVEIWKGVAMPNTGRMRASYFLSKKQKQ